MATNNPDEVAVGDAVKLMFYPPPPPDDFGYPYGHGSFVTHSTRVLIEARKPA